MNKNASKYQTAAQEENLILNPESSDDYKLLELIGGYKVEQFGPHILMRPSKGIVENTPHPLHLPTSIYTKEAKGSGIWSPTVLPWTISWKKPFEENLIAHPLLFELRQTTSPNIGVFPEHYEQWLKIIRMIKAIQTPSPIKILNLFGHTGGATLAAAAAGAMVCHVDASSSAINMAKKNQSLSQLEAAHIRWIYDDCLTFVQREVKRGNTYEGIILDPPSFGRGKKHQQFIFEKDLEQLLNNCKKLLPDTWEFILVNIHTTGVTSTEIGKILSNVMQKPLTAHGTLDIQSQDGKVLSFAHYALICKRPHIYKG